MTKYLARLVNIVEVDSVPEKLLPFVEFKAKMENHQMKGSEKVALINIETTESYHVAFLDKEGQSLAEIEQELKEFADASLESQSRQMLENYLENKTN